VQGWCRSEAAVDEDNAAVHPASDAAIRWSATGALLAAQARRRGGGEAAGLASCAFAQAELALRAVVGDIVPWNAAPERTHDEVLAAFERAIELLRPSGQPRATAQKPAPFDHSDARKEVRREMSAEAEQAAEAADETAEAPAAEETTAEETAEEAAEEIAEEPAAEETAEEPAAEEHAAEETT
jgi:ubiquinol-cytochrome c reductase cytochrome c1 subunit